MADQDRTAERSLGARPRIPGGVWALGFVSLLMDVSSEMIHALLPVYLVVGLGTSTLAVGFIEGIAEATAAITKVFSGALSDRLGKRKLLAATGYGMAALTKPVFPLADTVGWLIAARFIDRVGKGVRGAPRDALVADIAPPEIRGAAFGLRQTLDTVGAFGGPLIAIALMWVSANDFRFVFWIAVLPAAGAFLLILFAVHEPKRPSGLARPRLPLSKAELARLPTLYWWILAVAAVFTLARFSEAFLILRAQQEGLALVLVPSVLVLMNAFYALSAYPAGLLSDRMNRGRLLSLGLVCLIIADLILAASSGLAGIAVGVAMWGLHMGLTQGLLSTLVADSAPADLRGTAFGVFNVVCGVAMLIASVLAGALWTGFGAGATFMAGAFLAAASLFGLKRLEGHFGSAPRGR